MPLILWPCTHIERRKDALKYSESFSLKLSRENHDSRLGIMIGCALLDLIALVSRCCAMLHHTVKFVKIRAPSKHLLSFREGALQAVRDDHMDQL